jgi:hypothetical protein
MNKNVPQSKQDLCKQSEAENSMKLESAVLDIEGMCGGLFCDDYFIHFANLDAMAIACERYSRVLRWWQATLRMGDPRAPAVWNQIQARMDARAAARALDAVCRSAQD